MILSTIVLAWQSAETEEEYVKQDGGPFDRDKEEDLTLTEKEIEQVIRYRKNCEGELLHDPVKGQITMEQAFASGENWLVEMGVWDHSRTHSEPLLHRASLGTKTAKEGLHMPIEPYYSFWTSYTIRRYSITVWLETSLLPSLSMISSMTLTTTSLKKLQRNIFLVILVMVLAWYGMRIRELVHDAHHDIISPHLCIQRSFLHCHAYPAAAVAYLHILFDRSEDSSMNAD